MNQTLLAPLAVRAEEGHYVDLGDHRGFVKIGAQASGGAFLFLDIEVDPDGGVPPHIHTHEDETFYILSGQFVFGVGDETITAGPGDTLFGPRGVSHSWRCHPHEPGRLLVLITPGGNFEAFATEMARRGADPQKDMADPALVAEFVALAERYGIAMLPTLQ